MSCALLALLSVPGRAQTEPSPPSNPSTPASSSSQSASSQDSTAAAPTQIQPAQAPSTQNPSTQSSSTQSSSTQPTTDKNKAGQDNKDKESGTSKDRLFYALPNFLTLENKAHVPPLTTKQKFAVVARGTFDPVQYPWWGLVSALAQAEDSEPAYGQGWAGYGKRYLTTAADSTIENFMVGAVFASALHQDPRFYQSGSGGFFHRTGYAVSRIVVTRSDSGHQTFNFSEVFGSAAAAAISTYSYHPRSTFLSTPTNPHMFIGSDRTLGDTASVWGTQLSLDTATIILKEFWPDIHRKMSKKSKAVQVGNNAQ